ncbi:MFS transporter [Streptosporangium sp. 'caverna']|uniref:MFS transporter n=1 Tax=Streptosporangium sp. 'caverna' TaxID=2202249 RepID=UPI0013A6F59D|nr:MFS transporter [Streptosporangium sp. 'caverna']
MLGAFTYLTLYVQGPLGAGPVEAGIRFLAFSTTSVAAAILISRFVHRLPMSVLIAVGPGLIAVALLVMTIPSVDPWIPLMAGLVLSGAGLGAGNVISNQVALTAPADRLGMATGIINALKQVGTAVGVAILALPYGAGVRTMLLVAAALAAAGALLPLGLLRGRRPAVAGRPTG